MIHEIKYLKAAHTTHYYALLRDKTWWESSAVSLPRSAWRILRQLTAKAGLRHQAPYVGSQSHHKHGVSCVPAAVIDLAERYFMT